ncbi:hypothetical protein E1B28_005013 [Marasmius oreades]|uniref:AMP-dependent synthetase/ligase domain-containing protein n=1 Tax=Marasmius oreades TaxID=181124 RepID=A0A9P7UZU7_9AGAR|nr:uncharacterized protein E1B28_005013 [Marasmius oreades]KAG7097688.1 hypothetical protein E1B28_005013 [Marasmius oreades]
MHADDVQRSSASDPFFLMYEDDDGQVHDITWKSAVPAIHTAARKIQHLVSSQPSSSVPVIAMLVAADSISYYMMIAGIMRAGFVAFPISVRNSDKAVAHLLKASNAHHVLVSQDPGMRNLLSAALKLLDRHGITESPILTFNELYAKAEKADPLSPVQADHSTRAIIMHSSGKSHAYAED